MGWIEVDVRSPIAGGTAREKVKVEVLDLNVCADGEGPLRLVSPVDAPGRAILETMLQELRDDALNASSPTASRSRFTLGMLIIESYLGESLLFENRTFDPTEIKRHHIDPPSPPPTLLPADRDLEGEAFERMLLRAARRDERDRVSLPISFDAWSAFLPEIAGYMVERHEREWSIARGGRLVSSPEDAREAERIHKAITETLRFKVSELSDESTQPILEALALQAYRARCQFIALANLSVYRSLRTFLRPAERRIFAFFHLLRRPTAARRGTLRHFYEGPFSESVFFTSVWRWLAEPVRSGILAGVCRGEFDGATRKKLWSLLEFLARYPKESRAMDAARPRKRRRYATGVIRE